MGLWVALVFALLPLLAVRRVPPLAALRRERRARAGAPAGPVAARRRCRAGASTVALAALQVGSWRQGAIFSGAIAGALLVLWGASWALIRAVRRWLPRGWPYVWRQGVANLQRPSNQTATVVLAIGFGAFLLGTLFLVQYNLLRHAPADRRTRAAQPGAVRHSARPARRGRPGARRARATARPAPVPIVPMRIQSIKGRPVTLALADTPATRTAAAGRGTAGRSAGSTARPTATTLVASERLVAGRWWTRGEAARRGSRWSSDVARELGVGVGDEIVWDVQGVPLATRVASLREVDWARFEPNFFVVFAPGDARAGAADATSCSRGSRGPADRGTFQRRIAERLPNVTSVDLSSVQETLERLIDRVVLAIRFMALFTLGTGALVLVGALATSRFQRIREGALLRTLGATRAPAAPDRAVRVPLARRCWPRPWRWCLAGVAGWALARFVFDGTFDLPLLPFTGLGAAVVALTVAVGLANSREVLRRPPLEVLRGE